MKRVQVIMSSYNGEKNIIRQLDSIMAQEGVNVSVLVRDDGSHDHTVDVLKNYGITHNNLRIIEGDNIGWRKSFLEGLKQAEKADYYAFSDQDDVWISDKLYKCIQALENETDNDDVPVMVHCNRFSCDEELRPFETQSMKVPRPINKKNALTQEFAQGCTIVMNEAARMLVTRIEPDGRAAHDFWTGLICYYFGKVYYLDERLIYHIRYNNSASFAGNIKGGQKNRLKKVISGEDVYYNPAEDLIRGYSDLLTNKDKTFLRTVANAKKSLAGRIRLLFDFEFRRVSIGGTLLFKACILFGRY